MIYYIYPGFKTGDRFEMNLTIQRLNDICYTSEYEMEKKRNAIMYDISHYINAKKDIFNSEKYEENRKLLKDIIKKGTDNVRDTHMVYSVARNAGHKAEYIYICSVINPKSYGRESYFIKIKDATERIEIELVEVPNNTVMRNGHYVFSLYNNLIIKDDIYFYTVTHLENKLKIMNTNVNNTKHEDVIIMNKRNGKCEFFDIKNERDVSVINEVLEAYLPHSKVKVIQEGETYKIIEI